MIQYSNCAEPTENVARKERIRKEEEEEQIKETAWETVRATLPTPQELPLIEKDPQERVPALLRFGPMEEGEKRA